MNLNEKAKKIVGLLEQNTNLTIVRNFLKDKELTHSASSWHDLLTKRILPHLNKETLKFKELESLLNSTEEHGKQHIFLYKISEKTAKDLLNEKTFRDKVKTNGDQQAFDNPTSLITPKKAEITGIRQVKEEGEPYPIIIKIIETRWHDEPLGEEIANNILTKTWQRVSERAVNIAKLHPNGLLEIRISSQTTGSNYEHQLSKIWDIINPYFEKKYFREISLNKAKERLITEREDLSDTIKFSTTTLRNDSGNTIKAATGAIAQSLTNDQGIDEGINAFLEHNGYCDGTNIWFLQSEERGKPSTDIHIKLSGMIHEFSVPAHCIHKDYEYVLREILTLNG